MKTDIEEMVTKYTSNYHVEMSPSELKTLLTEAYQAGKKEGIDEAVEIIKKQTRYNMESDGACSDPECCGYPAYDMWESDDGEYLKRDDTIKALQDNK